MFGWLRRTAPGRDTALVMVDPRPGDELLVLGADNPALAAEAGAITGLNGRAVVVDENAAAEARIHQAAAKSGALLEFVRAPLAMLPFDPDTFKVVVIPNLAAWPAELRAARLAEAMRVARPAGRLIVIAGQKRGGLFGALPAPAPALAVDAALALLTAAGAIASRRLAEVNGVGYYEGRKPR